jgi:gamma-glutamylputrescine oxidase
MSSLTDPAHLPHPSGAPGATLAHTGSYYAASGLEQPDRPALAGEVRADVCVVGAGYTGLSAALHLAERGLKVVVVEAARVGWGASGRNGGQIVHSYSRDIDVIEARHGAEAARMLGGMAFEGAAIIRERVARYGIDCHLVDGGLYAAITNPQARALQHHKALWERWGHPGLELLDRDAARRLVGSERYIALMRDPTGGHIHPLRLAQGQAAALESLGGAIHELSPVIRIERAAQPVVHTASGRVVADQVVVACNAYIGDLEPALRSRTMPCGTQVVATEPLGDRFPEILPGNECLEDLNYLLDYFRLSADRRLIYGGGVVYGAKDPGDVERFIRPKLEATYPQLKGVRIEYAWTGNFQLTMSRLPEVGRLAPNIWYSHGCSGHGVTFTHLIGRVLSEALHGQMSRFDAFAQLPHLPFPGGRVLRVPLTWMGAVWYDLRDKLGV